RHEDLARDVGGAGVVLADKRVEDVGESLLRAQSGELEIFRTGELPLAHGEDRDAAAAIGPRQTEQVLVQPSQGEHLLPLAHGLDGPKPVAIAGGSLVLESLGSLLHLPFELFDEVVGFPFEKEGDLVQLLVVLIARLESGAGSGAELEVVIKARPVEGELMVGAGAIWDHPADGLEGASQRDRVRVGPVVLGAISPCATDQLDARKVLV